MKFIKTFELFDSEDLKSQQEIEYLKGSIDKQAMVKDIRNPKVTNRNIKLRKSLLLKFPFLIYASFAVMNKLHGYYSLQNEKYTIGMGIDMTSSKEGKYSIMIMVAENKINGEREYLVDAHDVSYEQLIEHIKNNLPDALKQYGFEEALEIKHPLNN